MNGQERAPRRIVRSGLFELDTKSKELHRSGIKVKLNAQPPQALILLLEHADDVVTREELRLQLWKRKVPCTQINFSGYGVYQDLFGGNCEAAARKISWALCRILVRPFDYIVKAGHRPTKLNKIRQDSEELSHEKS